MTQLITLAWCTFSPVPQIVSGVVLGAHSKRRVPGYADVTAYNDVLRLDDKSGTLTPVTKRTSPLAE